MALRKYRRPFSDLVLQKVSSNKDSSCVIYSGIIVGAVYSVLLCNKLIIDLDEIAKTQALMQSSNFLKHRESSENIEYGLDNAHLQPWSANGRHMFLDKLFHHRRKGIYVQIGANSSELTLNTLFLENERQWTGMIVETNPYVFESVAHTVKKAFIINCCIGKYNSELNFSAVALEESAKHSATYLHHHHRSALNDMKVLRYGDVITIKCFPLQDLLTAGDVDRIDVMLIDASTSPAHVLRFIDWSKVTINTFFIKSKTEADRKIVMEMLERAGYEHLGRQFDADGDVFRQP